jgi:hypothetical protein
MTFNRKITSRVVDYLNSRPQFPKKIVLIMAGVCAACFCIKLILAPAAIDGAFGKPDLIIQPPLQSLPDSTDSKQLHKTDSL